MKNKRRKWYIPVYLITLCGIMAIYSYIWMRFNHAPIWGDGSRSFFKGAALFQAFQQGGWYAFGKGILNLSREYVAMPSISLLYFVCWKIFGLMDITAMLNVTFLCVAIVALYATTQEFFDREGGILATVVLCSIPGIIAASRLTFNSYYSMCLLMPAFYYLLRSECFTKRKYALLCGVTCGLVCVIRYEGIIFLVFPGSLVLIKMLLEYNFKRQSFVYANAFMTIGIILIMTVPWIISHWGIFIDYYFGLRPDIAIGNKLTFSFHEVSYYALSIYRDLLGPAYSYVGGAIVLVVLIEVVALRKYCIEHAKLLIVLGSIIFPLAIFSIFSVKGIAHIWGILPFVSMLMAGGVSCIRSHFLKRWLIVILCFVAFRNIAFPISAVFSLEECPRFVQKSPLAFMAEWGTFAEESKSGEKSIADSCLLMRARWDDALKEIVHLIKKDYSDCVSEAEIVKRPSVVLLRNNLPLRPYQLAYYNILLGNPLDVINLLTRNDVPDHFIKDVVYDYFVIVNNPISIDATKEYLAESSCIIAFNDFILENQDIFQARYEKVTEMKIPRNSVVSIYRAKRLTPKVVLRKGTDGSAN
jgi:hypothetical protein